MNKCFSIIILLLFFLSVNCITASNNINLDDCSTLEKINLNIKECVNFFNNYAKQINKTSINDINIKSDNTTDINKSSVINVYSDTSDLGNNSSGKYNKSNVLFNDTSLNQSQFNKSLKVFELDKDSSVNDNSIDLSNGSVSKGLNSSEINNISNNNFSRDNYINHVSEPKNSNDYIMLLIPILLVLLGAIILYKKNK